MPIETRKKLSPVAACHRWHMEVTMKIIRTGMLFFLCAALLSGCQRSVEEPAESSIETAGETEAVTLSSDPAKEPAVSAQTAYAAFLSGDLSLFHDADIQTWGLQAWADLILPNGNLEYTYLDLDDDGAEELLVQCVEDPCSYNGVFHYENGSLSCWQHDYMEGSCRDYPLTDGTMVRQYDFGGACSYTLFRYQSDGSMAEICNLFAREELLSSDSDAPCPYYEIDDREVDKNTFYEQLDALVTSRLLKRQVWEREENANE